MFFVLIGLVIMWFSGFLIGFCVGIEVGKK